MIDSICIDIRDILNEHLKNEFSLTEDKVVLSNMASTDEVNGLEIRGKIVLFLVGIEEESTFRNNPGRTVGHDANAIAPPPPNLHLNIHVMLCSNFSGKNYTEGMKYLSSAVKFFQVNKLLKRAQKNNSSKENYRLTFDLCKLDFDQLSNLWSAVGSNLMPSVLYKIRVLVVDDLPVENVIPVIKDPSSTS